MGIDSKHSLAVNTFMAADSSSTLRVFLDRQAFLCLTEQGAVFLDLKHDKYFGLGPADVAALQSLMMQGPAASVAATALAHGLVERGVLTFEPSKGKALTAVTVAAGSDVLAEAFTDDDPDVTLSDAYNFLKAFVSARLSLARGLQHAVMRTRGARAQVPRAALDVERARHLVRVFRHIRPLVFTAKDRCLLNSAVLVNFLRQYGISADWVFAVKSGPFRAHCWVQRDGFVFNDLPELVSSFTPIMVV